MDDLTLNAAVATLVAPGGYLTEQAFEALVPQLGRPESEVRAGLKQRGIHVTTAPRLPRWPRGVDPYPIEHTLAALGCRHLVDFLIGDRFREFRVLDGLLYETPSFRVERLDATWLERLEEEWRKRPAGSERVAALGLADELGTLVARDPMVMRHMALAQIARRLQARLDGGVRPDKLPAEAERLGVCKEEAGLLAFAVVERSHNQNADALEELAEAWKKRELKRARALIATLEGIEDDEEAVALVAAVQKSVASVKALMADGRAAESAGDVEAAAASYTLAARMVVDSPQLNAAVVRCGPPPPANLRAMSQGADVVLEWEPSTTNVGDITYRVTCCEGRLASGPDDGRLVAETSAQRATDLGPPIARELRYAVHACRDGSVWAPEPAVASSVVLAPDITDLRIWTRGGAIEATWKTPSGLEQVEITRRDEASPPLTVYETAPGRLQDERVTAGRAYTYRFTAAYRLPSGAEVRSAGVEVTETPEPDPIPVEQLAVVVEETTLTMWVSWVVPPGEVVALAESDAPFPVGAGVIVGVNDLAHLRDTRWHRPADVGDRSLRVETAPGDRYLTAITVRGSNAAIGPTRRVVTIAPVRSLGHRRFQNEVRLSWEWPVDAGEAVVVTKVGSIPSGEFDPNASRQLVRRTGGRSEVARIPVPNGTHGFAVYAVRSDVNGRIVSAPASTLVGPVGATSRLCYSIAQPSRFASNRRTVKVWADERLAEPIDFVVVARPGDVRPLAVDDPGCIELVRVVDLNPAAGSPVESEVDLTRVPRPCYLRGFASGPRADSVHVVDPRNDDLKGGTSMGEVTCPYCFNSVSRRSVLFRCLGDITGTTTGKRCAKTADDRLAAYVGAPGPATLGPVFEGDGSKRSAACPTCGVVTFRRTCPDCHNDLPSDFADLGANITVMIGARTSGKSTYIAVLIRELQHRVGAAFGATVSPMDDRTIEAYKQRFEDFLYGQRMMLPATQPNSVYRNYPLLYRIMTSAGGGLLRRRPRKSALVFFDTAGEDLHGRSPIESHVRYLAKANSVLLLVDPLQIAAVRDLVGSSIPLPAIGTPPEQILENVTGLVRSANGIRSGRQIPTPIAVAFSKVDALWPYLPPASRLHQPSNHDGEFDERDAIELSDELRALLHRWTGDSIDRHLQFNYARYRYFGLSALGAAPDNGNVSSLGIAPFRVEDPLLWLLARTGIVQTRKAG